MHEITFATLGGSQVASWVGRADARCVVAVVPALGVRADYYRALADALVAAAGDRVAVVVADLPGHGKSPIRASRANDWGYAEVVRHLAALREAVRRTSRGAFVWLGHSIGGQLALMDAEHADAVILVASGSPYQRAWRGVARARLLAGTQLTALIGSALGHYPGERFGFGGREARSLMRQWAKVARDGRYVFGDFDGEAAIGRVKAPVLAISIEGDTLAPAAAVDHTLGKMRSSALVRRVWTKDAQGELARGNQHNRWPRFPAFPVREALGMLVTAGLLADAQREGAAS